MGSSRNPGMLAVIFGVALGVLFALLGFTQVLEGRTGFGLAAVCLVVSALIYIYYSRANLVEKTGYTALLFIIATALIIPFLLVSQQQAQATQANAQYDLTLHRGAAIFGQYCASCHGYQGQGLSGPKLNNSADVNKLTDDDLHRIIGAGVPSSDDLTKYQMPAWSQQYGGPLSDDDINYLVSFVRSSDQSYLANKGLPNTNGFNYVLGTLSNPTQIADYQAQLKGGSKPQASSFDDLTSQSSVTIDAQDVTGGPANWGWLVAGTTKSNLIIKAGTTVTWGNKSSAPHNVYNGYGKPAQPAKFPSSKILAANSSDTYSYTFTTPGEYPYFCNIHPAMVGWITVQ